MAIVFLCPLLCGYFYAEMRPVSAICMVLATAGVSVVRYGQMKRWQMIAATVGVVAIPLAAAITTSYVAYTE